MDKFLGSVYESPDRYTPFRFFRAPMIATGNGAHIRRDFQQFPYLGRRSLPHFLTTILHQLKSLLASLTGCFSLVIQLLEFVSEEMLPV
jgi:hypothetical protein